MKPRFLGIGLFVVAGVRLAFGCINGSHDDSVSVPVQLPPSLFKVPPPAPMPPPKLDAPAPVGTLKLDLQAPVEPVKLELPLFGAPAPAPTEADARAKFTQIIQEYEASPAKFTRYEHRIDYSAALVYLGRAADAIPVLRAIEADFPGRYATAANLGTAYELVGEVRNAKTWIQRGIKRNPKSHRGTEWLHVAILETKLKIQDHPDWLAQHSVLDGERKRKPAEVEQALEYQLNERLYFIKGNDPIMCDLFYEAARLTADDAKCAYFVEQAALFGSIRTQQLAELPRSPRS